MAEAENQSLWSEAAVVHELLELIELVRPLMVSTDCLLIRVFQSNCGKAGFGPDPDDVKPFDIIASWIRKLDLF